MTDKDLHDFAAWMLQKWFVYDFKPDFDGMADRLIADYHSEGKS